MSTAPTATLHWFLPTNGDSRHLVGGGHGVSTESSGTLRPGLAAVPFAPRVAAGG